METELKSFDIGAFDPNQDMFIEASAGTGKTYTIQKIVAKLVETRIKLNEILIVTYTEKAAGELRDRIRKELTERMTDEQVSVKTKELFQKALREVDTATIGTIHSFCQKALRDYAFEAGQAFSVEMVDDAAVEEFIDCKIRDEWVKENDFKELLKVSADVKGTTESLKAYFKSGVEKYFEGVKIKQDVVFADFLDAGIKSGYTTNNIDFNDTSIVEILVTVKTQEEFIKRLNTKKSVKGIFEGTINARKRFLPACFVVSKIASVVSEWKQYKAEHGLQSYNDMIDSVRDKVVRGDQTFCSALQGRYSYAIIDEFQDTNQRQWDIFQKLFLKADAHHLIVVGDPKQSIYSFQGADIDVYKRATKEITDCGGAGFRLDTNYRSTNDMIEACNLLFKNLKGNVNNDSALGDGFIKSNMPSDSALQKPAPLFNGDEIKPFLISEEVSAEEFAKRAVACIRRYVEKDSDGKTRLQVFDKNDPGQRRNVTLRDFAVLARTCSEMEPIEEELRKKGVPFLRYKDTNLFAGCECREWIALFKALNAADFAGDNLRFLNEVLVTDFFGVPVQHVSCMKYQRGDCEERALLQEWKCKLDQHLHAQFLEDVFAKSKLNERLGTIYRLQEFAKMKQLGDYAIRYLIDHQASLANLILHLESLARNESQAEDENGNLVAKSTDFDAVQVMTMHASKGLEFPVVISVGGFKGRNSQNDSKSFFLYHDGGNDDAKHIVLGVDDDAKAMRINEELTEWQRLFYVAYTRASSLLMLPCYEEWNNSRIKSPAFLKSTFEDADYLDAYCDRMSDIDDDTPRNLKDVDEQESPANISCVQKQIPIAVQRMHSYSSLAHDDESENAVTSAEGRSLQGSNGPEQVPAAEVGIDPKPIIFQNEHDDIKNDGSVDDYPAGAAIGNVLHNTLETLCNGGQGLSFADFGARNVGEMKKCEALRELLQQEFAEQGFYATGRMEDWIDYSIELLWNTLNGRLKNAASADECFRLADLAPKTMKAELEYYLNADGVDYRAFCKGFMDLVFLHQGRYCILDWKSDRLESYDAKSVKARVDESYSIQRVLYSYCLIQWLKTFHPEMSESEIFEMYFGGIYYVLLRGTKAGTVNGIYGQTWPSYEALKACYDVLSQKIETLAKK